MRITNNQGLPEALVKAVTFRQRKPGRLSATTMLKGVKSVLLEDRHWDDIEVDVEDQLFALFGKGIHHLLEDEGENEFTEEFMSYEIDGVTVTGIIDNYDMKTGVITDWKTVKAFKIILGKYDDWWKQGMIYAWLLKKNGFEAKTCQFIALLKDHSKQQARRSQSYPKSALIVHKFDVTDDGLIEIEKFIKSKITEYKQNKDLLDDDIPPCTPEERWDKPTTFAVMKPGNKRATKVLDTNDEAEKYVADIGKGAFVETRQGESVRCADYCSCCEFCNFYRDNVAATAEDQEAVA
jgi:hypothetical protein